MDDVKSDCSRYSTMGTIAAVLLFCVTLDTGFDILFAYSVELSNSICPFLIGNFK